MTDNTLKGECKLSSYVVKEWSQKWNHISLYGPHFTIVMILVYWSCKLTWRKAAYKHGYDVTTFGQLYLAAVYFLILLQILEGPK